MRPAWWMSAGRPRRLLLGLLLLALAILGAYVSPTAATSAGSSSSGSPEARMGKPLQRLQAVRVLEPLPAALPADAYMRPRMVDTPAPTPAPPRVEAEAVDKLVRPEDFQDDPDDGQDLLVQRQRVPTVIRGERHRIVDPQLRDRELRRQAYELWARQHHQSALDGQGDSVGELLTQIRGLVDSLGGGRPASALATMDPEAYRAGRDLLDQYSEVSAKARELLQEFLTPADLAEMSPAEVLIKQPAEPQRHHPDDPDYHYSERVFERRRRWSQAKGRDGDDLRSVAGDGAEFLGPEHGPLTNARPVKVVPNLNDLNN